MKRKKAKEILAESFEELAQSKSINKITIREIADNCGYSTATFYRHFSDKYDLIAWNYSQRLEEIMSQLEETESSWEDTGLGGALYFDEQRDYLANLFLHTSGLDSFISYMREINFQTLKNSILKVTGEERLDTETEMYARIYVLGTVQLTCEWILGKYDVSPQELARIYINSLPQPLRELLLSNEK